MSPIHSVFVALGSIKVSWIAVWSTIMLTMHASAVAWNVRSAERWRRGVTRVRIAEGRRHRRFSAKRRALKREVLRAKLRLKHCGYYWSLKRIRLQYVGCPADWYAQYWEHQELQWLDDQMGLVGRPTFRNWMKLRERDWLINEKLGDVSYQQGFELVVPEHLSPEFCAFMRRVFRDGPELALSGIAPRHLGSSRGTGTTTSSHIGSGRNVGSRR